MRKSVEDELGGRHGAHGVGVDQARRDAVRGDAERPQLARPRARHADDARLGGRVRREPLRAEAASTPTTPRGCGRSDCFAMCGTAARAHTITPRRLTSSISCRSSSDEVLQRRLAQQAGVVDEDVEAAPLLGDAVERALDGEGVGDVGRERQRLAAREADLLRRLGDRGWVAVEDRDEGAGTCERARRRGADAAAGAGHDGDAARQREDVRQRAHGRLTLVQSTRPPQPGRRTTEFALPRRAIRTIIAGHRTSEPDSGPPRKAGLLCISRRYWPGGADGACRGPDSGRLVRHQPCCATFHGHRHRSISERFPDIASAVPGASTSAATSSDRPLPRSGPSWRYCGTSALRAATSPSPSSLCPASTAATRATSRAAACRSATRTRWSTAGRRTSAR